MSKIDHNTLTAQPETEDFAHKYTEEGQGRIGRRLLDNYFRSIESLLVHSGISDRAPAKAIEIGCGEGFSTQRLRAILPATVQLQASEYVADMIPRAQKRNPNVTVFQESAYETGHEDNSFDIVFLLEVLEHLDYPDAALEELARILKPGGYLVLGVPREPLWRGLNILRGKYVKDLGNTPGHLNHWSSRSLKRYTRARFDIEATTQPLPWTQLLLRKR